MRRYTSAAAATAIAVGGIMRAYSSTRAAMGSPFAMAVKLAVLFTCGALGAFAGFALAAALGWTGVPAAVVAVFSGMAAAALVFALGVAALRKAGWLA